MSRPRLEGRGRGIKNYTRLEGRGRGIKNYTRLEGRGREREFC